MDNNIIGFILSYVLVFAVLGVATILLKVTGIPKAILRKVVHIGVSNWWIMSMYFFDSALYPVIGAGSFVVINFISYRRHLFNAMESSVQRENLGTVYFPVSLVFYSALCFGGFLPPYVGAIAILVMGYGDGLAAVAGLLYGRHTYRIGMSTKSLEGSLTMFIVSFLVVFIVLSLYNPVHRWPAAITVASAATIIEGVTPLGLDNISVPLIAGSLYWGLYLL